MSKKSSLKKKTIWLASVLGLISPIVPCLILNHVNENHLVLKEATDPPLSSYKVKTLTVSANKSNLTYEEGETITLSSQLTWLNDVPPPTVYYYWFYTNKSGDRINVLADGSTIKIRALPEYNDMAFSLQIGWSLSEPNTICDASNTTWTYDLYSKESIFLKDTHFFQTDVNDTETSDLLIYEIVETKNPIIYKICKSGMIREVKKQENKVNHFHKDSKERNLFGAKEVYKYTASTGKAKVNYLIYCRSIFSD